ncbi:sensor domain-containing diguanylate cyclase/phosphohydrolase [Konateibacter massiliensis]|uniref:sensor domain-containing diguanylate cyclase/phosphohydrolase n=1 Tax=Konateibacter massiliensis TaxID=2002841 RepID=UPI000C16277D|nr:HD domain-containing phosphohydrolase [Konateibacter massiliensis]
MIGKLRDGLRLLLSKDQLNQLKWESVRICTLYLVIGFLWISFSDRLVAHVIKDSKLILVVNTYKGLGYVLISTILLFYLMSKLLKKVDVAEKKLTESYDELSAANEELQAYVEQLTASESELRSQYDQIIEFDKMLRISEEKYKTLVSQMQLGLALYEGTTNEDILHYKLIDANYSHEVLTGFKKNEVLGKYFYEIHREMKSENLDKIIHTVKTGEPSRYERYQIHTDLYYEIIAYRPMLNQLAIIVNDITKRKQAEEQMRISENNFRNLFEHSSDSIFLIDDFKITNCNNAAARMLGFTSRETIIGKSPTHFAMPKQPDGSVSKDVFFEKLESCMKNGKTQFEWWHLRKDGFLVPNDIMMTAIESDGKKVIHTVCRDISNRKEMEEKLNYLSYHDQLTGLYNRRFFEEEMIRLDAEENYPLMLTMADINGLKLINDSFGHTVGDSYIQKVATVLTEGVREQDVVCRLAGDEFIIFSPKTDLDEMETMIQQIKELAKKETVNSVALSISFGFCAKTDNDESILEVLKKAENYMYKRKLIESPSIRGKNVFTIMSALHEKNPREEQHSLRVSCLCEKMGLAIGMSEDNAKELKTVGLLHDIGKIAIEEGILNKEGKLTEDEWEEVKRHPEIGYRILSTVNEMSEIADYILAHHERWDGKGYPKGLKGEEIPIQSRIIAIADAYDAMTSERSYRQAMSQEYAVEELKKEAGAQFYEPFVKIFIDKVLSDESTCTDDAENKEE